MGDFVSLIGTGTVGLMGARVGARVLGLTGPVVLEAGFGFMVGARVLGLTGPLVLGAGFGFMVGARVLGLTGPLVLGTGFGFMLGARVLGITGPLVLGTGFGFMVGARVLDNGRAQEHPFDGPWHSVSRQTCVLLLQRQTHRPPFAAHPLLVGVPSVLVAFVTSLQNS